MGEFLFDTVSSWLSGKAYTCLNVGHLFEPLLRIPWETPLLVDRFGVFTETVIKEVISEIITTKEMWVVIELNYGKEIATAHQL